MDLEKIREEIDLIDDQLFELFEKRMKISAEVAKAKKEANLPILSKKRERDILERISKKSEEFASYSRTLYNTLFSLSKSYQHKLLTDNYELHDKLLAAANSTPILFPKKGNIAVQGTEGSYSQQTCDKLFPQGKISYFKSFDHVFDAVSQGFCDFGILPVENSSNGSVKEVYDLMLQKKFYIVGGYKLHIRHNLLVKPGTKLSDIKEIISHPQALGQCSEFLKAHPEIKATPFSNTALAAQEVAESERRDIAAISSKYCANLYGLEILNADIVNNANNYTRFICIAKDLQIYPGANKISLILTAPNEPGGLYQIMAKFAALELNITKLESRPMPGSNFEFLFYFDFEGNIHSEEVRQLIDELSKQSEFFAFLGNYLEH